MSVHASQIPIIPTRVLSDKKCWNCSKKLANAYVENGCVEIKCPKCGQLNYINGTVKK